MKQINEQAAAQAHADLMALLGTARQAMQPRDVSQRHCFDADYGSYTGHPADPRHVADEEVGEMLEAINCAEASLAMARAALEGYGNKVSTLTARSLFNEAREFLEVAK